MLDRSASKSGIFTWPLILYRTALIDGKGVNVVDEASSEILLRPPNLEMQLHKRTDQYRDFTCS